MKKIIIILLLVFSAGAFAQTGIGTTTPNASAQLEVSSTNKGFLPPRVALTSTSSPLPLAAHVAGMVVYNTATVSNVTPGLYVNNGSVWEKQIGATNINGLYDGKSNGDSVFLGSSAGWQNNGINNTGVGINALYSVTSGADNVAIGYQASPHTITTSNNTVIGSNANKLNFGSDNVSVGSYAGYQTNGSGNVLLGNHAGYFSSSSALNNKLYIENSDSATPLIYGEFDNDLARINGNFEVAGTVKIEGGLPGLGKVLTSDANGLASWQTSAAGTATTLTGLTSTVAELNTLDGFTGTVTDLNYAKDLSATGVTNTEFTYLNGVTSNIQTQLNGKLSTTGNAATATKLATPITIGGVSFDGSANISLPGVNTSGNQNTSGNAATATKLATPRQLNGINFDGSANITVPTNLSVTAGTTSGPTINSSSGTNVTIPSASSIASGVVTTGTQTFVGAKTLAGSLLITGTGISQSFSSYYYISTTISPVVGSYSGALFSNTFSINAADRIAANAFIAHSDKRIKTDIKPIENSITTIKKLKPSSYTKIDKVKYGTGLNYGFIAQELEAVIPEAVTKGEGEVPVLKKFDDVAFEEGVTYKLLVKDGEEIKEQSYTKEQTRPAGELFVLNKKIHDFRTVDYNMVFSVAVAAIQEQQKKIEELQKGMQEQQVMIDELKKLVSTLVKK